MIGRVDEEEGERKKKKEKPTATNRSHASSEPSTASELRPSVVMEWWATASDGSYERRGKGVALRVDRG